MKGFTCASRTKEFRRHALIELSWDGERRVQHILIRDLGSTNGTLVNGERVASADLRGRGQNPPVIRF
jgi:pSer/pThr/pTyr-binding forkhead associated (FHA) protein